MAEKVNVLDRRGRVSGSASRDEVHSNGLWHRGVHVLVFNQRNEVLLPVRSSKRPSFPGCYDVSVSEHVKAGERYVEAAERGLLEELGISGATLLPRIEFRMNYSPQDNHFSRIYTCTSSENVKIDKEEVESARFVDLATLKSLLSQHPDKFASWATEIFKWLLKLPSKLEITRDFDTTKKRISA
jgi:isopentenyldiphosphate isomerase